MGFPIASGEAPGASRERVGGAQRALALRPSDAWFPGFTLIELLVVLAIVALLLSIAAPRYFGSLERSKEAVLKENLFLLREAIDQYYADRGRYPPSLEDLVEARYLRRIPLDPVTGQADTWIVLAPAGGSSGPGGIFDVKSGAEGRARDGTAYGDW